MSNHHQWLTRQLPQWVAEGLVSEGQADVLRERYPVKDTLNLGRLLLTGIAAVMIGLGVILLFAYNWSDMGKFSKLAVIFSALIAAHLFAFFLRTRHHVYSESLFALGSMLMGAGIFLVGQVYHLDSHYPNAFLFWSLGALALAWALPSLTQAFMAIVLVITWHLSEVFDFQFANHSALVIVLVGLLPLVWRLHSPILARFISATLFVTLAFSVGIVDGDMVVITLLSTAMVFIAVESLAQLSSSDQQREIARELAMPAILVMVAIMYVMSFGDLVPELLDIDLENSVAAIYFFTALGASQAAFFWLLLRGRMNAPVRLAELTVLLALLPSLLAFASEDGAIGGSAGLVALGMNLILLALSVWLMVDGARNANRKHMVRGSILFALLAMARYTDLFDSLVARALVFLLVGAALFAVSHYYQRNKRQAEG